MEQIIQPRSGREAPVIGLIPVIGFERMSLPGSCCSKGSLATAHMDGAWHS